MGKPPPIPISNSDVAKIAATRSRLNELAALGAGDYAKDQQFPAGQFDQACTTAVEALWQVMVLAHIHFGTPLP